MLQLRFFFQWILDFATITRNDNTYILGVFEIGLLLFAFRIFDAITDPLTGIFSDILYKRGYRRTFLMKLAIPMISFGLVMTFSSSTEFTTSSNWIRVILGFFFFFSGYTLYCIPYWTLVEDLSYGNNDNRYRMSSSLGIGVFIATALGFILTPFLVDKYSYFYASLIVSIISTPLLCFPILLDVSNKSKSITNKGMKVSEIFSKLLIPLKNKEFSKFMLQLVPIQMAFTALTAISPVFVKVILVKDKQFLAQIMGPIILSALITFIFLGKLVSSYGWKKVLHFSTIMQGVLFILVYIIFVSTFELTSAYIALFFLFGLPIASVLGIEAFAVTQVMKDSNDAGLYYGTFNFLVKSFNGLIIFITGYVVETSIEKSMVGIIPAYLTVLGVVIICSLLISNVFYKMKK